MDALENLLTRRSVRKFRPDSLDRATIERIVDAGRLAPTARNLQPWEFIAVTDRQRLAGIAEITDHGRFIAEAPLCIAVLCSSEKYYLEDGSAATTCLLLAAHALGLGSCWVAGDKKPYAGRILQLLGAPPDMRLVALVAVGRPDDPTPRAPKRQLGEVLHWERYGQHEMP